MEQELALRAFMPARDFKVSRRFYEALGFRATHRDDDVCVMKIAGCSFILQNRYEASWAENTMLQLLVRDVEPWWAGHVDAEMLVAAFGVKPPKPPALQPWGLMVGFIFDPSGVLLHVAESPF